MDRGFFFHADMFAAAERLLAKYPVVADLARWRFRAVFIDEMQDTSEMQARLLACVFPTLACGLRQRLGDSNQAIFDPGKKGASTDRFPGQGYRSLPSSQRFGPQIAAKAEPLAPVPPEPSLIGAGPRKNGFLVQVDHNVMPHTIFLFATGSAPQVLPAFARLLLETFADEVLQSEAFLARAIGRSGKSEAGGDMAPRHLGDYWTGYEPRAAKFEPRPETLADYVHLAQRKRDRTVDCAESVRTVVRGIRQLVETVVPDTAPAGSQSVRWLWESLNGDASGSRVIRGLLWRWCVELAPVDAKDWSNHVASVRKALRALIGEQWNADADAFCEWSAEFAGPSAYDGSEARSTPNRYRFTEGSRFVDIDVGTIHSAKGQTHTATLVMETLYKEHDMEDLLPWLTGDAHGAKRREGPERLERMRLIYTAMTRPSHLLCLVMRRDALGEAAALLTNMDRLVAKGWRIQCI